MVTNVWWFAADKKYPGSSYEDLKARRVIAQGWPLLGDLTTALPLIAASRDTAKEILAPYCRTHILRGELQPEQIYKPANTLHFLLQIEQGDVLVALEGTTPRGMAESPLDALSGYRYDDPDYNYAHVVADDVEWVDLPPDDAWMLAVPGQGIQGVRRIRKSRKVAEEIWSKLVRS